MSIVENSGGIEIKNSNIAIDSNSLSKKYNIISHAHFDHLKFNESSKIISSNTTASLASVRTGKSFENLEDIEGINLLNSGHIVGSKSVLIDNVDNKSVLYTGDVSTTDRLYLEGFKPVSADILVIESTYGVPGYNFPKHSEVEQRIAKFIEENKSPKFLFGYSLGKAQKIQKIIQNNTDKQVIVGKNVEKMHRAVEQTTSLNFEYTSFDNQIERIKSNDAVFLGSTSRKKDNSLNKLVKDVGGVKAGFSGWAVKESYKYRNDFDKTFILSDHADFNQLMSIVNKTDPEKIYTTHGFEEEFAAILRRKGFDARSIKSNQYTLNDF